MQRKSSRSRARQIAALTSLACIVAVVAYGAGTSSATTGSAKPQPVVRTIYGTAEPVNAPGQSLTLQQVVIAPGAKLPTHFHEGTQLSTIRSGVLTYHAVSGPVSVTRRGAQSPTPVGPGVVKLRPGDTIVEPESLVHFGANRGKKPVVIELAALLRVGAPLSTPVGAGGAGTTPLQVRATLASTDRTLHQVGAGNRSTYGWNRLAGATTIGDGPAAVELLGNVDYTGGSGPFTAFLTITLADGSALGATVQGQATANAADGSTAFAATVGVVGGTGRYAAITGGSGTFTGSRTTALGGNVGATFDLELTN
jgi:hypothetical protein